MGRRIFIIGIDPGTTTGVACYNAEDKKFVDVFSCGILEAIEYVRKAPRDHIFVRIEDARKRKWFGDRSNSKQQGAGSIKRDCTIWEEMLEAEKGIPYEFTSPGKSKTKMKSDEFKKYTGWTKTVNEHARDAAMLVIGSPVKNI